MTREERARDVLRDQFDDSLAKWVVRYGDPPAAVGTHHAIAAMLAFADAEAAAMRERAAECADAYAKSAAEQRQLCTIDGGDESGDWYWAGREKGARDLAPILRALPATGEVE